MRRVVGVLLGALLSLGVVLGTAPPAAAHATLLATDPVEGTVLAQAPESIRFTFNEAVNGVPDGVRVFDALGEPVDSTSGVSGDELAVTLTDDVGTGTLVVVWRVVSADGHPVSGSLTFSIGAPSTTVVDPPDDATAVAGTDAPLLLGVLRWLGYVGLLVTGGLVAFAVLVLPREHDTEKMRTRIESTARITAVVGALAWLAALPVVALYQAGTGIGSLASAAPWSTLTPLEYVVPLAGAVGLLLATRLDGVPALAAGVVALAAPSLTGHTRAATPQALAVAADVLHLVAGAVWLGGLLALAMTLGDLAGRGDVGGRVVARFSGLAAGVLAALVVTGALLTWRIVGSWGDLVGTGYGRMLLVKIGIAVVAVGLAAANRWLLLPRLQEAARRRDRRERARPVVRAVAAEATLLVGALLLTGLLVDTSPEPEVELAAAVTDPADPASTGPHSARLGNLEVVAAVSPHATGPAVVPLQLRDSRGVPTEGLEAPRARLSTEGGDGVEPLDLGALTLEKVAAATYSADVVLPTPGVWQLQVSLRTSRFESPVAVLEFAVA